MKFEYSKEKYMYKDIKDELPFDDDSYVYIYVYLGYKYESRIVSRNRKVHT